MKHLLTTLAAITSATSLSSASVIVNIFNDGSDLIISSSGGTLDVSGLTRTLNFENEAEFDYGFVGFIGYYNDEVDTFEGAINTSKSSGWTQGTGFVLIDTPAPQTAILGAEFYPNPEVNGPALLLPAGFQSGDSIIAFTARVSNFNLSDGSLTENESISYTWDNGGSTDSITFVTSAAVPEPSSSALLLLGGSLAIIRRRR